MNPRWLGHTVLRSLAAQDVRSATAVVGPFAMFPDFNVPGWAQRALELRTGLQTRSKRGRSRRVPRLPVKTLPSILSTITASLASV